MNARCREPRRRSRLIMNEVCRRYGRECVGRYGAGSTGSSEGDIGR